MAVLLSEEEPFVKLLGRLLAVFAGKFFLSYAEVYPLPPPELSSLFAHP